MSANTKVKISDDVSILEAAQQAMQLPEIIQADIDREPVLEAMVEAQKAERIMLGDEPDNTEANQRLRNPGNDKSKPRFDIDPEGSPMGDDPPDQWWLQYLESEYDDVGATRAERLRKMARAQMDEAEEIDADLLMEMEECINEGVLAETEVLRDKVNHLERQNQELHNAYRQAVCDNRFNDFCRGLTLADKEKLRQTAVDLSVYDRLWTDEGMHQLMSLRDVVVAKTKRYRGTGLLDVFAPEGAEESVSGHSILDSDLLSPSVVRLTPQEMAAINKATRTLRGGG